MGYKDNNFSITRTHFITTLLRFCVSMLYFLSSFILIVYVTQLAAYLHRHRNIIYNR